MSTNQTYRDVCQTIVNAGGTPLPMTDTLIEIIRRIIDEDETEFILAFRKKKSQTMEQLRETTGLTEEDIVEITTRLARKGVIFNQPSSRGIMVYRLLPLVNVGIFEYMFMQKLVRSEENRKLGQLFVKLFEEYRSEMQDSYDKVISIMDKLPAVDRTVPVRVNKPTGNSTIISVNKSIDAEEKILMTKNVVDLIEKFDEIAVGHCFCRHHKDLLDQPCKQTDLRECCFTFGKSARYTSEQGFMRMIEKKEALEILMKAEEDGLVHKAYHPNFDVAKDETSVCNCCKCCCGNSVANQIAPIVNVANFIAEVDPEACIGCGTCADNCHSEAAALTEEQVAMVDESRCIGCGVCAYFCPEDAIRLSENDRVVRIAPPRAF
jgi:ferredoxin